MTPNANRKGPRSKNARNLADLVGDAVSAVCKKRGFASADLIAAWPDIAGGRYAERVQPVRLIWPRQNEMDAIEASGDIPSATLLVYTDGATAMMLSHETGQIISRINTFFGWAAVSRIKIVQKPVARPQDEQRPKLRELTQDEQQSLDSKLADVENDRLKAALKKLGAQVIARKTAN
ncbi:putative cytoplasmic protein [Roseibium sp. TrichSKD4]|uniref:DUF721 domain-containing protein n=1 Tax=Roseibium sp. TrichSKD4 TaxID=744980 RepID=UPI0001E56194|nr:DciA family protein [Roseibium sp. TrichSKD4]EFO34431.1 putative cytoplasmic protein [Roseibium sp. TrichSKD4]